MGKQPEGFKVPIVVPLNAQGPQVLLWDPGGSSDSNQGHQMPHVFATVATSHMKSIWNVTTSEFLQQ